MPVISNALSGAPSGLTGINRWTRSGRIDDNTVLVGAANKSTTTLYAASVGIDGTWTTLNSTSFTPGDTYLWDLQATVSPNGQYIAYAWSASSSASGIDGSGEDWHVRDGSGWIAIYDSLSDTFTVLNEQIPVGDIVANVNSYQEQRFGRDPWYPDINIAITDVGGILVHYMYPYSSMGSKYVSRACAYRSPAGAWSSQTYERTRTTITGEATTANIEIAAIHVEPPCVEIGSDTAVIIQRSTDNNIASVVDGVFQTLITATSSAYSRTTGNIFNLGSGRRAFVHYGYPSASDHSLQWTPISGGSVTTIHGSTGVPLPVIDLSTDPGYLYGMRVVSGDLKLVRVDDVGTYEEMASLGAPGTLPPHSGVCSFQVGDGARFIGVDLTRIGVIDAGPPGTHEITGAVVAPAAIAAGVLHLTDSDNTLSGSVIAPAAIISGSLYNPPLPSDNTLSGSVTAAVAVVTGSLRSYEPFPAFQSAAEYRRVSLSAGGYQFQMVSIVIRTRLKNGVVERDVRVQFPPDQQTFETVLSLAASGTIFEIYSTRSAAGAETVEKIAAGALTVTRPSGANGFTVGTMDASYVKASTKSISVRAAITWGLNSARVPMDLGIEPGDTVTGLRVARTVASVTHYLYANSPALSEVFF